MADGTPTVQMAAVEEPENPVLKLLKTMNAKLDSQGVQINVVIEEGQRTAERLTLLEQSHNTLKGRVDRSSQNPSKHDLAQEAKAAKALEEEAEKREQLERKIKDTHQMVLDGIEADKARDVTVGQLKTTVEGAAKVQDKIFNHITGWMNSPAIKYPAAAAFVAVCTYISTHYGPPPQVVQVPMAAPVVTAPVLAPMASTMDGGK